MRFIAGLFVGLLVALVIWPSSLLNNRDYGIVSADVGKVEFEKRGFTNVTLMTARTDGNNHWLWDEPDTIFTYSGGYGDGRCRLRLVYNADSGTFSYTMGGGELASTTISDISVAKLNALKRPELRTC